MWLVKRFVYMVIRNASLRVHRRAVCELLRGGLLHLDRRDCKEVTEHQVTNHQLGYEPCQAQCAHQGRRGDVSEDLWLLGWLWTAARRLLRLERRHFQEAAENNVVGNQQIACTPSKAQGTYQGQQGNAYGYLQPRWLRTASRRAGSSTLETVMRLHSTK